MRHYVKCRSCGQEIYFNSDAKRRSQLPPGITLQCSNLACPLHGQDEWYAPRDVWAKPGHGGKLGGAAVMGAIGALVAGPVGGLVGAAIGGRAGNEADKEDEEAAEAFNRS